MNTTSDLTEQELISAFSKEACALPSRLYLLAETDSTNTYAKQIAYDTPDDTLVLADHQIAGKGRLGRTFESPAGVGIFMTMLYRPSLPPCKAPMLTLVAGISVCEAIRELSGLDAGIKWPNDIVVNGKKVCGILTEMHANMHAIDYILVGIGINVNNPSFSEGLSSIATSLFLESGQKFHRSRIIACIKSKFSRYYDLFLAASDFSPLKERYQSLMIHFGREILILQDGTTTKAVAKGISEHGELIIERDGVSSRLNSGEISIRGVYGYV